MASDQRFRSIFDQAMVSLLYTDGDGRILEANPALCEMLGYTLEELRGLTATDLIQADQLDRHRQLDLELVGGTRTAFTAEERYLHKDRRVLRIRRSVRLVQDAASEHPCLIQVMEDVTDRIGFEDRFRETFDNASVGIMHSSLDRRVLMVNRKFCEMVGYSAEELQQGLVRRIHHPEDTDADQHLEKRLVAGEIDSFSFEKRYVRKDGSMFWAHRTVSLAGDGAGKPRYFIRIIEDISTRKQAELQLRQLAHHDTLTGLPNRTLFYDRLTQSLMQARRNDEMVGVMFLDLDRFKLINDTLGHAMGDLLLRQVAHRLIACVRASDTVSRLSGDEFGIILGEMATARTAQPVAEKIVRMFQAPFVLADEARHVTMSIGISLYPTDAKDEETLIKAADVAMYRAKEAGRNSFRFYNDVTGLENLQRIPFGKQ